MMSRRDNFAPSTKRVIAQRVNYICSNPACRKLTIRAHSDPEKSLSSGVAAHILGADPGGPRYDESQCAADRKHPRNGIWLCHGCSDVVDKDESRYPASVLEEWRAETEEWVAGQGLARLPNITISTIVGLTIPLTGGTITGEDIRFYREHRFAIQNSGSQGLESISGILQFPEPIVAMTRTSPPGTAVVFEPDRLQMQAHIVGNGRIEAPDLSEVATCNFRVIIDRLLPHQEVLFTILTGPPDRDDRVPDMLQATTIADALHYFFLASFLYERHHAFMKRTFLVPIDYDSEARRVVSEACDDSETRQLWRTMST